MRLAVTSCMLFLLWAFPALALHDVLFIQQNIQPVLTWNFVSSRPSGGAAVTSPDSVTITFSRPANADQSSIKVLDLYGTPMTDGTITASGNSLSASLPALANGEYKVEWKARCACEDPQLLNGSFHFTVQ